MYIGPGERSQIFRVESNQNHFLTTVAQKLSKANSNANRRVDQKELIAHMDNSMCQNGRKIQDYFAKKR
jgi:hypothetical protein